MWQRLWNEKKEEEEDIPDRLSKALIDKECFVNNYCYSTNILQILNGLALMHTHAEIELDLNELIDLFANPDPRGMRMANILED